MPNPWQKTKHILIVLFFSFIALLELESIEFFFKNKDWS